MKYRLICADVRDALRMFADDSFDSIVTDAPYELGFMGKTWDQSGIAYDVAMWRDAMRVLKPGAHLCAFGGSRTYHRLACAIEDAGFEIRDQLQWLYGCLSDDTEILTTDGWVRYNRANEAQHALAFNCETGWLHWEAIRAVFKYDHEGEMVALRSADTDQLLTLNHRVILEDRPSAHAPYIPNDEALLGLLATIPYPESLPVASKQDVLSAVQDGAHEISSIAEADGAARRDGSSDMHVRRAVLAGSLSRKTSPHTVLLTSMQRQGAGGSAEAFLGEREGKEASRQGARRCRESSVEGRRYRVQEARELLGSEIRPCAGMGTTDGTERRLRDGASATDGRPLWVPVNTNGSHQSRGSQSDEQRRCESDAVAEQPRSQTLRMGQDRDRRLLPSTPVSASVVDYAGVVWCINVPSGAFVARRNGKIFVTGNSGFPKSLDVSKAIDKHLGAEREIVGTRCVVKGVAFEQSSPYATGKEELPITEPATAAAAALQGWGTALKPSHEPIVLARKPFRGTVAANVLKHGTGALNIDACRIATDDNLNGGAYQMQPSERHDGTESWRFRNGRRTPPPGDERTGAALGMYQDGKTTGREFQQPSGRWPANVLLDEEAAALLDAQSGISESNPNPNPNFKNAVFGRGMGGVVSPLNQYSDSGGASRFFYTAKADRRQREQGLDDFNAQPQDDGRLTPIDNPYLRGETKRRNSHPTVKPIAVMAWLVRLVTPLGGTVLDLFVGSGSTGMAAIAGGFDFVGIDKEQEYIDISRARIRSVAPIFATESGGDLPVLAREDAAVSDLAAEREG